MATTTSGNGAAANVAAAATTALASRTTSNAPATMMGLKSGSIADYFGKYRDQIARAIPKYLTPDRMIQLATTMVSRNPDLKECTIESLVGAVMQCAILGFEPIPQLGLVAFVPRKNRNLQNRKEVNFQLQYKGKIALARRSNEIKTVYAQAVYTNDTFEWEFGLDPVLKHKPAEGERGAFKCAYAVAKYTNDGYSFEVMSKHDIDKIRIKSPGKDSDAWTQHYDEMAKKTVVNRLSKYMPLSVEVMKAMAVDNVVLTKDSFVEGGDGEVDLNKVEYTDVTDEATTETKQEGSMEETSKAVVDESTGEVTQADVDALNEANAALGNPMAPTAEEKKDLEQNDLPVDERLLSEILTLDEKNSPLSVIQIWYQENLVAINNIKPAPKAKKVMDAFKAAMAAAKERA